MPRYDIATCVFLYVKYGSGIEDNPSANRNVDGKLSNVNFETPFYNKYGCGRFGVLKRQKWVFHRTYSPYDSRDGRLSVMASNW